MKNKITLFLCAQFLLFALPSNAQFLQDADYAKFAKNKEINNVNMSDYGFSNLDDIPSSYSLEKYCTVSDQGNSSSCVGFAVAHGAMSILHNLINGYSEFNHKIINGFDPFYVYCSIKDGDDLGCVGCDCGAQITDALDVVVNYGCKKIQLDPFLECSNSLNKNHLRQMVDMTGNYSIDNYYNLCSYKEENGQWYVYLDIDEVKEYVSRNYPIVAGIEIGDNFDNVTSLNQPYKAIMGETGRHAVTIVGYDDNKHGGSFRILNSYGSEWGDDGLFWMPYEAFHSYCDEAYILLKEDWDSFAADFSYGSFFKGLSTDKSMHWEGFLDTDGYFTGRGIATFPTYIASAGYKNGKRHGWWMILENFDQEDPWGGWVLYDNGEYVEEEAFGFSSPTITSVDDLKEDFHMEQIDYQLSDELLTKEELSTDITEVGNKNEKAIDLEQQKKHQSKLEIGIIPK